ncbi:hypothetical protein [Streptomyces sp. NPDC059063]|uniref:hypothetical protein n=1 Tax=unclassified Streptomyces TaxID=2593676 RepID=UPI0036CFBD82
MAVRAVRGAVPGERDTADPMSEQADAPLTAHSDLPARRPGPAAALRKDIAQ